MALASVTPGPQVLARQTVCNTLGGGNILGTDSRRRFPPLNDGSTARCDTDWDVSLSIYLSALTRAMESLTSVFQRSICISWGVSPSPSPSNTSLHPRISLMVCSVWFIGAIGGPWCLDPTQAHRRCEDNAVGLNLLWDLALRGRSAKDVGGASTKSEEVGCSFPCPGACGERLTHPLRSGSRFQPGTPLQRHIVGTHPRTTLC